MGAAGSRQAARTLPKALKNDVHLNRQSKEVVEKNIREETNFYEALTESKQESTADSAQSQTDKSGSQRPDGHDPQELSDRLQSLGSVTFREVQHNYVKDNSMLSAIKNRNQHEAHMEQLKEQGGAVKEHLSPQELRSFLEARKSSKDTADLLEKFHINQDTFNKLKLLQLPNNLAKQDKSGKIRFEKDPETGL